MYNTFLSDGNRHLIRLVASTFSTSQINSIQVYVNDTTNVIHDFEPAPFVPEKLYLGNFPKPPPPTPVTTQPPPPPPPSSTPQTQSSTPLPPTTTSTTAAASAEASGPVELPILKTLPIRNDPTQSVQISTVSPATAANSTTATVTTASSPEDSPLSPDGAAVTTTTTTTAAAPPVVTSTTAAATTTAAPSTTASISSVSTGLPASQTSSAPLTAAAAAPIAQEQQQQQLVRNKRQLSEQLTDSHLQSQELKRFKGIIQNVQISNLKGLEKIVVFFANDVPKPLESIGEVELEEVLEGEVSDDTCRVNPCSNNGECMVTWNDFVCKCPEGYKGKHCSEIEYCHWNNCPTEKVNIYQAFFLWTISLSRAGVKNLR